MDATLKVRDIVSSFETTSLPSFPSFVPSLLHFLSFLLPSILLHSFLHSFMYLLLHLFITSFLSHSFLPSHSCALLLTVDRKTIQRLLDSLQAENKIIQLSAVLPKGIALVITKEGTTITTMSMSLNEAPAEVRVRFYDLLCFVTNSINFSLLSIVFFHVSCQHDTPHI